MSFLPPKLKKIKFFPKKDPNFTLLYNHPYLHEDGASQVAGGQVGAEEVDLQGLAEVGAALGGRV